MDSKKDINIPKEDLQKINSIIGKATCNDYHWWNLIGIIKNLMEDHANKVLSDLKINIKEDNEILPKVVHSEEGYERIKTIVPLGKGDIGIAFVTSAGEYDLHKIVSYKDIEFIDYE